MNKLPKIPDLRHPMRRGIGALLEWPELPEKVEAQEKLREWTRRILAEAREAGPRVRAGVVVCPVNEDLALELRWRRLFRMGARR